MPPPETSISRCERIGRSIPRIPPPSQPCNRPSFATASRHVTMRSSELAGLRSAAFNLDSYGHLIDRLPAHLVEWIDDLVFPEGSEKHLHGTLRSFHRAQQHSPTCSRSDVQGASLDNTQRVCVPRLGDRLLGQRLTRSRRGAETTEKEPHTQPLTF
jgi:hypothetical protein